jgi:predicted transglutaminase-like cysteine proteinase
LALAIAAAALLSCAHAARPLPPVSLDFFVPASTDDPWQEKIENWQARHNLDPIRRGERPRQESELASEYESFALELRRRIAADTIAWVQEHSRRFYRPDGERDHWATLGEVIESGGDDCDGLDLLTFQTLRKLGFAEREIFRAILVERETGQHHMVTLWFASGDRADPFVLDPTAVVTAGMVRLSEVPAWDAIELFDESAHFRVEPSRDAFPSARVAGR